MDALSINRQISKVLLLILITVLMAACSSEDNEAEQTVDPSERAIQTVIEKEFNGPDKKYQELWDAMAEVQVSDLYVDDYEAFLESPEYLELITYMKNTYSGYFTENGLDAFINSTPAFMYSNYGHGDEFSASDIEITQSANGETLYDFTFQVELMDQSGESNLFDFSGKAIVPEEGKIGKIEFSDQDNFLDEIRNDQ